MKKKILVLAAVLSLACAANSFAAAMTWLSTTTGGGTQAITITSPNQSAEFKPSANVYVGYAKHATGAAYTLATYHLSGTFTYATTSVDTNIFRFENTNGNATQGDVQLGPDAPASATAGVSWTGWTASK